MPWSWRILICCASPSRTRFAAATMGVTVTWNAKGKRTLCASIRAPRRAVRGEARVDAARLGAEALERAAEERFDLVLPDYRLPDMTGLDVLAQLRARKDPPAVILMTAQGSEEVAIQALRSG